MNANQINYLNIGLMLASCIVAFIVPFEMFLFSYAILGPLHYLTEISWLHKRQCFSPGKNDFIIMGIMALAISIPNIFPHFYMMTRPVSPEGVIILSEEMNNLMMNMSSAIPALVFVGFAGSALLLLTPNTLKRLVGFVLIGILAWIFHTEKLMFLIFTVLVPTLVHVFVFTGLFILVGALKSRSFSGILSLLVFIACGVSFFVLFPNTITGPSPMAMQKYDATFLVFNQQLYDAFIHADPDKNMIYNTTTGTMLARFIAFAYTYHYLNWFSKTSIIKWHQVSVRSLIITGVIWVGSVLLYFSDYRTGIMALYFLSYLHVIFEFPLNFHSIKDIGKEISGRLRPARGR